jgi:hypothetical protein
MQSLVKHAELGASRLLGSRQLVSNYNIKK